MLARVEETFWLIGSRKADSCQSAGDDLVFSATNANTNHHALFELWHATSHYNARLITRHNYAMIHTRPSAGGPPFLAFFRQLHHASVLILPLHVLSQSSVLFEVCFSAVPGWFRVINSPLQAEKKSRASLHFERALEMMYAIARWVGKKKTPYVIAAGVKPNDVCYQTKKDTFFCGVSPALLSVMTNKQKWSCKNTLRKKVMSLFKVGKCI